MIKTYFSLTKPGIIMGNAITCAAGFAFASKGNIDFLLLIEMLLGLSFIVASGCVANNYLDRESDEKMKRTQNRALVKGLISPESAQAFAISLALAGTLILTLFANLLTVSITLFGLFVYIVLYSSLKHHTVHGTLVGSIAGAIPPVAGYAAVSNQFDGGALILFAIIALWQMPHFYAIAIFRFNDYAAASIPVLPVVKGMRSTKIQMMSYVFAFIPVSLLPTYYEYTGNAYLMVALPLGLGWLWLSYKGFSAKNDAQWAWKMFRFSLLVVMALCATIPFSV